MSGFTICVTTSPPGQSIRGVPLPTVARLLGHRQVSMTLRYAHVHDKEVEAAAERVGRVITNIWDPSGS